MVVGYIVAEGLIFIASRKFMIKRLIHKKKVELKDEYYLCEDMAKSYYDFGVPRNLAEEWISAKTNTSKEVVERACYSVYYKSRH